MMLHRHFDDNVKAKMTRLSDVSPVKEEKEEFVSEVFPPDEQEEPKRRGRPKKSDTE